MVRERGQSNSSSGNLRPTALSAKAFASVFKTGRERGANQHGLQAWDFTDLARAAKGTAVATVCVSGTVALVHAVLFAAHRSRHAGLAVPPTFALLAAAAFIASGGLWGADQRRYTGPPAQPQTFLLDNSALGAGTPGLSYRSAPLEDIEENAAEHDIAEHAIALWGSVVTGVDLRNGWLEVPDVGFLPFEICGVLVLSRAAPGLGERTEDPIAAAEVASFPPQASAPTDAKPAADLRAACEQPFDELPTWSEVTDQLPTWSSRLVVSL